MSNVVSAFNECKHAIGQLLVRFDQDLSDAQKRDIARAWEAWSLIDHVGRARALKLLKSVFGDNPRVADLYKQLNHFNREYTS